ncbi:MAG: metalloregulator ArsR/SmtB family transcription factor [Xanthomonadaceae bacterium]|nr:metalloregulator ArsR/SmtB family transcription factor [Xanthomonadaceae bacterium]
MAVELKDLSTLLGALSDSARLRLLVLCAAGELTVKELTEATDMSQPRVSRHLRILEEAGILRRFRDQHWVYYRLRADGPAAPLARAAIALLARTDSDVRADARRLDEVLAARAREARAAAGGDSDEVLQPSAWALLEQAIRDMGRKALGPDGLGELLDVGTGSGRVLRVLGPDAKRGIGIDASRAARLAARTALHDAGLAHCSVRDADMYALPFDKESFDTVSISRVLSGAQLPWAALSEAVRVLRPSGRLLVFDVLPEGMPLDAWCQSLKGWLTAARIEVLSEQRLALPGGCAVLYLGSPQP